MKILSNLIKRKKVESSIKSKLKRIKDVYRSKGLGATLFKFYVIFIDHLFDFRYGIETHKWAQLTELTINSDNRGSGVNYQPTRVLPLRKLFKVIMPIIPSNSVLVDFGSGKGRVLLVASEFGFRKVNGVEFAHELCEIARKNCANYKAHKGLSTEYQIIECDALNYTINTDENVFFLFNPFDETVLNKVLLNIVTSLKIKQRKILVIYFNAKHGYAIDRRNDFKRLQEYNFWDYTFTVYSNLEQELKPGISIQND